MVNLQEPFFVFSPKCHCCPWGVPSEKSGTDCWFSWSPINNWATPRLLEVAPRHFFFFFAGTSASCFWKSGVSQWLGLPNDFIPHSCWYLKKKKTGAERLKPPRFSGTPPPKKKKHMVGSSPKPFHRCLFSLHLCSLPGGNWADQKWCLWDYLFPNLDTNHDGVGFIHIEIYSCIYMSIYIHNYI